MRIEDIDHTRCRPEFVEGILGDLSWLGLAWQTPVRFQSQHLQDYQQALSKLLDMGVLYPCTCSRKDIEKALSAPHVEDHSIYPGTCRELPPEVNEETAYSLRLDVAKAMKLVGPLIWQDEGAGKIEATPQMLGDVVLARKDLGTSYHLSVVVDDALQEVETVIRGTDLFEVTHLHRLLQALLDLPSPLYFHHDLILDESGERLAKRRGGNLIRTLREEGKHPDRLFEKMGLFPK